MNMQTPKCAGWCRGPDWQRPPYPPDGLLSPKFWAKARKLARRSRCSGGRLVKMTGGQVIRATQMFTKHGQSTKVSVLKEIGMGLSLGLAFGLVWKVRSCTQDLASPRSISNIRSPQMQRLELCPPRCFLLILGQSNKRNKESCHLSQRKFTNMSSRCPTNRTLILFKGILSSCSFQLPNSGVWCTADIPLEREEKD